MKQMRKIFVNVFAYTALMFGFWAGARIALAMYMRRDPFYTDVLLKIATDVEIHNLRIRWGWDVSFLIVLVLFAFVVQAKRRRPVFIPIAISTALTAALAVAMAYYPALTLSGRLSSPFTGIDRSLHESIAFAAVAMTTLAVLLLLLKLAGRRDRSVPPEPAASPQGGRDRDTTPRNTRTTF